MTRVTPTPSSDTPELAGDLAELTADIRWDAAGLLPAVVQDAASGEVLMVAWMNAESLTLTLTTRRATYWSRSRQELWEKGATSGHRQQVVDARLDCDQDTLLLRVRQTGPACHSGTTSCFEAGPQLLAEGDAAQRGQAAGLPAGIQMSAEDSRAGAQSMATDRL